MTERDALDAAENRARGELSLRSYEQGDEEGMAEMIAQTLRVSNRGDYPPDYLEEIAKSHSPAYFRERAQDSHFYVVLDGGRIIGCGGITGYRGSKRESYLISVFVLPEYQGKGIGRRIMEVLERDEFFTRARRTELGASLTAVGFYEKLGYGFKDGVTSPDSRGVVVMEKFGGRHAAQNGGGEPPEA